METNSTPIITEASVWAVIWGRCSAVSLTPGYWPSLPNTMSWVSQIGFLPNYRTSDHVYTLHTLINKHVQQKNKGNIFSCFIDFKKAFDSIWNEGLNDKILQRGAGGNIYDIIKSMYSGNKCEIKIDNKRTEFFTQGCSLSPTLFNIYISGVGSVCSPWPLSTWQRNLISRSIQMTWSCCHPQSRG